MIIIIRAMTTEKVIVVLLSITFLIAATIAVHSQPSNSALTLTGKDTKPASYVVRVLQISQLKLAVTASLPINGKALEMDRTRPADIPEVGNKGWVALISNLRVKDEASRPLEVKAKGSAGWELLEPKVGRITIEYEVDYSLLAKSGFPAPREAAFADADHFIAVGRSLFITTPDAPSITVTFDLPPAWHAVTPWSRSKKSKNSFSLGAVNELTENLIVLSRTDTPVVNSGGFRLSITALGPWQNVNGEINQVLQKVVPVFVKLMKLKDSVNYSLVLLPVLEDENGGESYRGSFAFSVKAPPSISDRNIWGQTIGHEIFHYWNGWRLRGSDYASSQWFQEGFTQYAADLAMVDSGLISADDFRKRISEHITNYRKLTTPLGAPGNKKGPPLYSGGALIALCWDIQIRHATNGKRNLGDFFNALWRQTDSAKRPYEWNDIKAALNKTAPLDWEAFFQAHIKGTEKLPLDKIFSQAGLQLLQASDGSAQVELSPAAAASSKSLWNALINGR